MSSLDAARFRALERYAGEWLVPRPFRRWMVDEVADLPEGGCAVYIVSDGLRDVQYVGSVHRPNHPTGVARRLAEHLRDPAKRQRWHAVSVIWLRDETPAEVVRRVEGAVGSDLFPLANRRLPALLRVRRR